MSDFYDDKIHLFGYNETMKIKTFSLFLICLTSYLLVACTPPEEEVHPKRPSARNENLKRYMTKALALRAQVQLRTKPIVSGPLLTANDLKAFIPSLQPQAVSSYLSTQQQALQKVIQTETSHKIAQNAATRLDTLKQDLTTALEAAQSPQEMTEQFKNFEQRYVKELMDLANQVQQESWDIPTAQQSRTARENLKKAGQEFLKNITTDYGETCAKKIYPVLEKAGDDYWLTLSSLKNSEEIEQALHTIGQEADQSFEKIITEYGDPMITLSPEQVASLRAHLIEEHQQVEQTFEKLYGKEAVLKTRDIFEPYLLNVDKTLQQTGRLSHQTTQLEEFGEKYRQQITQLQVQLNDELEKKLVTSNEANHG